MSDPAELVTLFDVDNTLLDNDTVQEHLAAHLKSQFGPVACRRYWEIFEQLRSELGYADYLGALQRYRTEAMHDPSLLRMSSFLINYPFADRLYPRAIDVVAVCAKFGPVAILSDGDVVFQPHKVERSGLWDAFDGRVLIYIHKEQELADVERHYPAKHYVLVDDKLRILSAVKKQWSSRVTTVFVKQGHYARDLESLKQFPPADLQIDTLADLLAFDKRQLTDAAKKAM